MESVLYCIPGVVGLLLTAGWHLAAMDWISSDDPSYTPGNLQELLCYTVVALGAVLPVVAAAALALC